VKRLIIVCLAVFLTAIATVAAQVSSDEMRSLRTRIEERFDVVALGEGIGLRPKSPLRDVRLIEISDGAVAINGNPLSGRELRERLGADADDVLRLSYLDADARRNFVAVRETAPQEREPRADEPGDSRRMRSRGDRVRIFGSVTVAEDEEISGQVVAVLGSAYVNGVVRDQVVSVLGSVTLGPKAVVRGDVVSVGGRVYRTEGSRTEGGVTEVALTDPGIRVNGLPWVGEWDLGVREWFSPVPRLVGSVFHFLLFALLGSMTFLLAGSAVEGAAERAANDPVKSTIVGLFAEVMFVPALVITAVVLAISLIGIPLLVLIPVAVFALFILALVGFSGTAYAVGRWARGRLNLGTQPGFVDVSLGVLVILLPLLVGRVIALAGWPLSPIAYVLVAVGFFVELLAWACGFGSVLTNVAARWRARRGSRVPVAPPAP
jgi:hypothetical protein